MNELVERTIDFLEKRSVIREVAPEAPEKLPEVPDTVFVGSPFFVEKFTYLVEEKIAADSLQGGALFINFQSFAAVLRRQKILKEIDRLDNAVNVYGADAAETWPFQRFKKVVVAPDDPLLMSWFIIYSRKDLAFSLVAVAHGKGAAAAKKFRGFWTTRPSIAHYLCDYLLRVVNAQYSNEVR